MEHDSKTDIFAPPIVGERLLKTFLPQSIAENEIGDLEEEYRVKAQQESIRLARRWYWIQVYSAVGIAIKEGGDKRLFKEAARLLLQWTGVLFIVNNRDRIIRQSWIAHSPLSLILCCLIALLAFSPRPMELGKISAQEKLIPNQSREDKELPDRNIQKLPDIMRAIGPPILAPSLAYSHITKESNEKSLQASPSPESLDFTATAYSLQGRVASGQQGARGVIAADRRILPLGARVRLEAGPYSGEYTVADRGGAVRGRKIDIWVPNTGEAMRFGRRPVKLTVLSHTRSEKTNTISEGENVLKGACL